MAETKTYLHPLPTKGYARNPELESMIASAKPADAGPYLVYADWLSQQGDPRGELIVLQHKLSLAGQGGEGEAIAAREAEILAQNDHFLGGIVMGKAPKHLRDVSDGIVSVTWRWGFIESARLFNTIDWMDSKFPSRAICERLFSSPAIARLAELKVGVLRWEYQGDDLKALIEEAAKAFFARELRVLRLGDVKGIDIDCAHHTLGDLSGIAKAFPKLAELTMWGCEFSLGKDGEREQALALPELRKLNIETCGLSKANLTTVIGADLPALEHLDLWFGSEDYGNDCEMDDLTPILDGSVFPKLKHLGLMNTEMADDLCSAIVRSKILPKLTSLDLSMGTMTDEGARVLLANSEALQHLEEIDVSKSFLSPAVITELEAIGPKIISDDQKEDEDDYRYVSVAE